MDCGGRFEADVDLTPDPALAHVDSPAEVLVLGAGLAGALAALVLGRRGVRVAVVDLHASPPPDFRCEKLSADQVDRLCRLGVLDAFTAFAGPGPQTPEALAARLTARGMRYDGLVAAARAAWPSAVRFEAGRISRAERLADGWRVRLSDGQELHGRVLVLATGAAGRLAVELGLERVALPEAPTVTVGLDFACAAPGAPRSLIHPGERAGDGVAYASLFPLGDRVRMNLFTVLDPRDPRITAFRDDPPAALRALAPRLARRLEGLAPLGAAEIRATVLARTEGAAAAGVVAIGDAHLVSCPATGSGVTRILSDLERLAEGHLPAWLASAEPVAPRLAGFYADAEKRAVDAEALAGSLRVRRKALSTEPGWRALRLAARVKAALREAALAEAAAEPPLVRGEWVDVRSATEIAQTLDARGALDGVPFMPEMVAFCGRRLRVARRADKLCVEGLGLRTLGGAVFLDESRCDGAAHDGCQRGCAMLWREDWLVRAEGPPPAAPADDADARALLAALPTRDGELYVCQSTTLAGATTGPLGRLPLRLLLADVRGGELGLTQFAAIVGRGVANNLRRAVGRRELGQLTGAAVKPDKGALDLQPGEWVRIRPAPAVAVTLDAKGANRGLSFEPEMTGRTGEVHRVAHQVERIVHEETGRMVRLTRTVALEGVDCRGSCAKNCPRANPLYWREAWLERVDGPDGAPPRHA